MNLFSVLFSSRGITRSFNEDNFYFNSRINDTQDDVYLEFSSPKGENFAVFDGMGGLSEGITASRVSAQVFSEITSNLSITTKEDIINFYHQANNELCVLMTENKMTRIGSTVVTLSINHDNVVYSNLGDSKLFRVRNHEITHLSIDHTEIQFLLTEGFITLEQAKDHPSKNKLTQHLGIFPSEFQIDPYVVIDKVQLNDIYILASDGLTNYLSANEILSLVDTLSLSEATDEMKRIVFESGASDNFTFIIVKVGGQ
jgi:serine/threonine protein phosphatase PrpC